VQRLFRRAGTRNKPNQNAGNERAKTPDQIIIREYEPPATDDHYRRYDPEEADNQNFWNDKRKDNPLSHSRLFMVTSSSRRPLSFPIGSALNVEQLDE